MPNGECRLKPFWGALLVGVSVCSLPMAAEHAERARQRQEMVRTIEQHARYTSDIIGEDMPYRERIALDSLTPKRSVARRHDIPSTIASIMRRRRSTESALAMHAGLLHQHAA